VIGKWIGLTLLASALSRPVLAQVRDTTKADSARGDTTDYSELFLKAQEEGRTRVPAVPRIGSTPILPALSRFVFDRDTIDWHNAETLGDLLTKVPGVYLWRGGWIGRPEPVNFQARGAASVEYYLDGFPYLPLGPDSVAFDPSLVPLSFLSRVEVERMPGQLRVYLYTRRHDRLTPRTGVGVSSGDFQTARYQGGLEKRFANGIGYAIGAEHLAVPLPQDVPGRYENTQLWLQTSYVPSNRLAVMVQYLRANPNRQTIVSSATPPDTLSQGLDGTRSDLQASLWYTPRGPSAGPRFGLFAGKSSWREDSTELTLGPIPPHEHVKYVDASVWQFGAVTGVRTGTTSFEVTGWHRSRWTPLDLRATAGWSPTSFFTASGEAAYQRHDGGRTSEWITGRLGIRLPFDLRATGFVRTGTIVNSPMLATSTASSQTDLGLVASFDHPRLAAEAGYWRTAGFEPQTFPLYRQIVSIAPSGTTDWFTFSGRIAPRQWLFIDGWYSNPIGSRPEGIPPTHSIVNATIQSKFLRTFRSGIFGLKLQGTMESWGVGVIGRDKDDNPIELRGATFFRSLIELKIGEFIAYYDRVNLRALRLGYVPGLEMLRLASTFGVRWEFSN
jgi:hypothetical protein